MFKKVYGQDAPHRSPGPTLDCPPTTSLPLLHCAATLVSPPSKSPSPPTSTPFPSSPSSPASPSPHTSSNPSSPPSSALEVFASPPCNASSGAPFPFDPLPWVQYYGLASQQGEIDVDMALSTRFLCGAERGRTKGSRWAWMWYTRVSSQYTFISVWSTLIMCPGNGSWQGGYDRQLRRSQHPPSPQTTTIKTELIRTNTQTETTLRDLLVPPPARHQRTPGHRRPQGLATTLWVPYSPRSRNYIWDEGIHPRCCCCWLESELRLQ